MLESELTAPQIACNISHSHVVTWCVYGGSVFVFLCVRFSILTNVQNIVKAGRIAIMPCYTDVIHTC